LEEFVTAKINELIKISGDEEAKSKGIGEDMKGKFKIDGALRSSLPVLGYSAGSCIADKQVSEVEYSDSRLL
jgi:hypothetical protein